MKAIIWLSIKEKKDCGISLLFFNSTAISALANFLSIIWLKIAITKSNLDDNDTHNSPTLTIIALQQKCNVSFAYLNDNINIKVNYGALENEMNYWLKSVMNVCKASKHNESF